MTKVFIYLINSMDDLFKTKLNWLQTIVQDKVPKIPDFLKGNLLKDGRNFIIRKSNFCKLTNNSSVLSIINATQRALS
jgi:hypothetical protein